MDRFIQARDNFRQNHAWLLLPLLFAICFIVPNRTGATNLYRLLVVIPMILCFRPVDMKEIWANAAARWFLILCGWMTLTLFWDGLDHRDWQLFTRELNVLALFYLVFLVSRHQQHRMGVIVDSLLVFGFLGAVLIIADWPGFFQDLPVVDYSQSTRGVFNNSIWVGWVMAFLSMVAIYQAIRKQKGTHMVGYAVLAGFFMVMTLLAQSRGAFGMLAAGVVTLFLFRFSRAMVSALFVLGVVAMIAAIILSPGVESLVGSLIYRGFSYRPDIWVNAWDAITASPWLLIIGHGLSADAVNQVVTAGGDTIEMAHYHSLFLNQLYHFGIIGLAGYIFALGLALVNVWKYRNDNAAGYAGLWPAVLIAIQIGFVPDGEYLFVHPSSVMLCFLLPWFLLTFHPRGTAEAGE